MKGSYQEEKIKIDMDLINYLISKHMIPLFFIVFTVSNLSKAALWSVQAYLQGPELQQADQPGQADLPLPHPPHCPQGQEHLNSFWHEDIVSQNDCFKFNCCPVCGH